MGLFRPSARSSLMSEAARLSSFGLTFVAVQYGSMHYRLPLHNRLSNGELNNTTKWI